jgi:heme exporter protein D
MYLCGVFQLMTQQQLTKYFNMKQKNFFIWAAVIATAVVGLTACG